MQPFPALPQLAQIQADADALGLSPRARERLQWLLYYAQNRCSVVETCSHFDIPRSAFYRLLQRFDVDHPQTLEDRAHTTQRKTEVSAPPEVVALIRRYRQEFPREGREKLHARLLAKHHIDVSDSTIGRVIERERLYFADTALHLRKRLPSADDLWEAAAALAPDGSGGEVCTCCTSPSGTVARWRTREFVQRLKTVLRALFWTGIIASSLFGPALVGAAWTEYDWYTPSTVVSPVPPVVYMLDGPIGVLSSQ